MPRKIRSLIQDLKKANFYEIVGGKGLHRKFTHTDYRGVVTISGRLGDDVKNKKHYQEKQVKQAIEVINYERGR